MQRLRPPSIGCSAGQRRSFQKCGTVMTAAYFKATRSRTDRALIQDDWIERGVRDPVRQHTQADGRIWRGVRIPEAGNPVLRVILPADGETVRNALFDRGVSQSRSVTSVTQTPSISSFAVFRLLRHPIWTRTPCSKPMRTAVSRASRSSMRPNGRAFRSSPTSTYRPNPRVEPRGLFARIDGRGVAPLR